MTAGLALFEDDLAWRFLPMARTRPVYDLRSGILTLRDKISREYGRALSALYCRPFLTRAVAERAGLPVNRPLAGPLLLLNGRIASVASLAARIPLAGEPEVLVNPRGEVVAVRVEVLPAEGLPLLEPVPALADQGPWSGLPRVVVEESVGRLWQWPWEMIHDNAAQVAADAAYFPLGTIEGQVHSAAHLLSPDAIYVGHGAQVGPGAILDATEGVVLIGEGAVVMPNAVVIGPASIGLGSRLKAGARVYEGTTIGPVCKIGGEVEASIVHGYSNKAHDGFMGHSFLGEWCNLGADTNTSDLKNNYSTVRIRTAEGMVDSGTLFLGTLMGDHSKTGINTMLNSGTVVGVACNLFGAEMPPKWVPDFSWGGGSGLVEYQFDRALMTAEVVMARRGVELAEAEAELLLAIYRATAQERVEAEIHVQH